MYWLDIAMNEYNTWWLKARLEKDQLTSQGFCRSTEAMRKHGGLVNSALGFFPVSTPCSLKHVWVHIEQALNRGLISTLTIIFYTPVLFRNCDPASEKSSKRYTDVPCAVANATSSTGSHKQQTTNLRTDFHIFQIALSVKSWISKHLHLVRTADTWSYKFIQCSVTKKFTITNEDNV